MDLVTLDLEAPSYAFGLSRELETLDSGWNIHNKHQLVYAAQGSLHLELDDAKWVLPPQCAAWIQAHVRHRAHSQYSISLRTIYLPPAVVPLAPQESCNVFSVNKLGREMIQYAMRWNAERSEHDALANSYFATLAGMAGEWLRDALPFQLATAQTPELARAMEYALNHLNAPSLQHAARVAGLSSRTLARRFAEEAQTTWQQWTHTARMRRAMELLSEKGTHVTEAATRVGYNSLSAFSKAFTSFAGETPSAFRQRIESSKIGSSGVKEQTTGSSE